jgi:hypothetical protein
MIHMCLHCKATVLRPEKVIPWLVEVTALASFPISHYCYTSLQPPLQQLKALVTPVKVITWSSLPILYK